MKVRDLDIKSITFTKHLQIIFKFLDVFFYLKDKKI